jgi:uncharacterized protein (DUF433 family)
VKERAMMKIVAFLFKLNWHKNITAMTYRNLIERNPDVLLGKPIIKGTRISVELVIRKLGEGYSIEDLLENYPHISKEQILAALQFAADMISLEENIEV